MHVWRRWKLRAPCHQLLIHILCEEHVVRRPLLELFTASCCCWVYALLPFYIEYIYMWRLVHNSKVRLISQINELSRRTQQSQRILCYQPARTIKPEGKVNSEFNRTPS